MGFLSDHFSETLSLIVFFNYRNSFYGFSSARNSIELGREKDRESLLFNSGKVSNNQLYQTDQGKINKQRLRCSQHGQVKYYTEQGTQTFRSLRWSLNGLGELIIFFQANFDKCLILTLIRQIQRNIKVVSCRKKSGRKKSFLSGSGMKLGRSRSKFSLGLSKRGYNSPPLSPSRNSLAEDDGEGSKKSETSFTKRNIKSQVSILRSPIYRRVLSVRLNSRLNLIDVN